MLVLVRHGESAGNAAGLLVGRLDPPLTEVGRSQAAALAGTFRTVSRLVTSPLTRARVTADLLGLGVDAEVDERWIEIDYGTYDGVALADVPPETWARWRGDPHFRPPQGETLAELGDRVRDACGDLFATAGTGARDDGADVVVVSHVSPIKAAVAWALGAGDGLAWRLHLSTGSVTRIGWGPGGPLLHQFNAAPGR